MFGLLGCCYVFCFVFPVAALPSGFSCGCLLFFGCFGVVLPLFFLVLAWGSVLVLGVGLGFLLFVFGLPVGSIIVAAFSKKNIVP